MAGSGPVDRVLDRILLVLAVTLEGSARRLVSPGSPSLPVDRFFLRN